VSALVLLATLLSPSLLQANDTSSPTDWLRVALLSDYNSRVVILGTTLLGAAAGLVGSFTLLRKRALLGDALSHATLPGIAIAFLAATALGGDGKSLPVLLLGATLSGLLGMGMILVIRKGTRIREDAALGIVLSVFFGLGMALLGIVQQMEAGHAAGLEAFIYGKTASMNAADARLIGASGLLCLVTSTLLFKELSLVCFDEQFGQSLGLPVFLLDCVLMGLVVTVSIVGLQAVGLILVIALLVIPAAAARFWTDRMRRMTVIAAGLGGMGAFVGAAASALWPNLPSGATIVLVSAGFFGVSMLFGRQRGVFVRWLRRRQMNLTIDRHHLLRDLFEDLEEQGLAGRAEEAVSLVELARLRDRRIWKDRQLRSTTNRLSREGLIYLASKSISFTATGFEEARRIVHQHRLWELYLIHHADVASSQVDSDADTMEHNLEPEIVAELERLLNAETAETGIVTSPHAMTTSKPLTATSTAPRPEGG
jgi:manganese/zinc/iron transport system permease protein